ncbi:MAG: glycine--tRNA ligase [Fibrobacter sp.]|jgi:glycyl-tRNA synthetase|nr:glycine--tRNA ligase [Fibrobacter sp.]
MAKKVQDALKDLVSLCKRRGFIFPGSEIYDGLANTWDYGPYGTELKRNIKELWWKKFVISRADVLGLDSSILLNPRVWQASGHVGNFSDPLVDCKSCHERFRADHLLEEKLGEGACAGKTFAEIDVMMKESGVQCPNCGKSDFTEPRAFNLMFQTEIGVVEGAGNKVYLRPETAQGIFINFKNIVDNVRPKIPFGVGQIGKSFRNEITPGNFIFRTREFEQMELEFFCEPGTETEWYRYWKDFCMKWLGEIGIRGEKLRLREHAPEELSHYSNGTSDVEYEFPFGWGELWGIASRTDYDLTQHQKESRVKQEYYDAVQNKRYIPYVVEPSLGVDRLLLVLLCDAYDVEKLDDGEERVVLHFHPKVAPVKAAVLPLVKKGKVKEKAEEIYRKLLQRWNVEFDETQSIGKRYRRQDELGTPYCITVDFDTIGEGDDVDAAHKDMVTVRDRDSMKQEWVPIAELENWLFTRLG